jgi:hypothetical protein
MAKKKTMAKAGVLESLWSLVAWLTGILVSLAVGFGMIGETLTIPAIPTVVTVTAGWIVVVLAILGALLKIIDKLGK